MNVLASLLVMQIGLLLAPPQADLPPDFPTKIWVQQPLHEIVTQMWNTSPTFRRQCLQIQAAPHIQVQLRLDPSLASNSQHRATCELRAYSSGVIIARVSVAPVRMVELIGHELEHVCERLEGIRVERETNQRTPGYYLVDRFTRSFESDRAIRVGRQVMAEMNVSGPLTRTQ